MCCCVFKLLIINNDKCRSIYTSNILDSTLIFFYVIKVFVVLDECYIYNINKCYVSCFSCSESVICISQDISKNKKKQQEECVDFCKYNSVNRGSYRNSIYIVQPGDTLFYIAWISGNNYINLARNNNIQNMHLLKVGQVLQMHSDVKFLYFKKLLKNIFSSINHCNVALKKVIFLISKKCFYMQEKEKIISSVLGIPYENNFYFKNSKIVVHNKWHWPTYGKIIDIFSESEGGNKGIDISGKFGQPILAVTNGTVVYVGDTLQGYGNLIIIQHDGDYLSAYAHNDMILVSEQQVVKIGDKIATMGSSGTNEIKLHFEIRYKGKSVNPLFYLSNNF